MTELPWLWIVFTLLAAGGQTVRNAMQRELTTSLGTVGATHVRFLFGFPFALLSLLGVALITGVALPRPNLSYWPWLLVGALAQIAATALMLAAMGGRSFVVVVAYIKTEPIQVAIFGLIFLGDAVSLPMMIAIVIATAGVLVMSYKPGGMTGGIKPTADRPCVRRDVRDLGHRLSRRDPQCQCRPLRDGGDLHARLRPCAAGRMLTAYLALRDRAVLVAIAGAVAPLAVRRLHGRVCIAVLVPRLRDRDRRERAHARAGRGAVRAGDLGVHFQAGDEPARRLSAWR